MSTVTQPRQFDPRPRRASRQWPLGLAVLVASVLNAIVWGSLLALATVLLRL